MSKRKGRVVATMIVTLLTVVIATAASADPYSERIFDENRVSGGAIVLDALLVRPVMLATTVVGGALFVVSAPFALVGGSAGSTWKTLVATPAEQVFIRCLGCTPVQDQRSRSDRQTALAAANDKE